MREFLRRKLIRVLSFVMSASFGFLAFLKWEAAYATLPGDVSGQVTAFLGIFGTGWLPIVVMLLLCVILFAVGIGPDRLEVWARWISRHRATRGDADGDSDRKRELETQEQRAQDAALDVYLNRMEQWLHDQSRPLRKATKDDEVRASAQERTLRVLEGLGPEGKRSVLRFIHRHRLIEHDETIISMHEADLSSANLSYISLTDARLDYAILHNADLRHAKLCGSFRGAV